MSRCAQWGAVTNSLRNAAAVHAPPELEQDLTDTKLDHFCTNVVNFRLKYWYQAKRTLFELVLVNWFYGWWIDLLYQNIKAKCVIVNWLLAFKWSAECWSNDCWTAALIFLACPYPPGLVLRTVSRGNSSWALYYPAVWDMSSRGSLSVVRYIPAVLANVVEVSKLAVSHLFGVVLK